ncbi:MAG TPA: AraC family transcriptional regulator [Steroidobacteraceae bacterium]|nr:AraC family transcriptional regulator [Steroidobacteraceae bacterium]
MSTATTSSASIPAPGAKVLRDAGVNRFDCASPEELGWHAHEHGQFILVESGVSHLFTDIGAWVIPARRVAWVPPGVRHTSRSSAGGRGWVVISPVQLHNPPTGVCVLCASALMVASLQRLTQLKASDEPMHRLLWQVVEAELNETHHEQLGVPMPTAPRMLKAAQRVLARPTAAASLDQLAAGVGMSRRSFARHFRSQTGLPYSRWRRAVIAQHALELVAGGQKVSSVAIDMGYESVSAFIAMFRRQYGESPRQFLIENPDRYFASGGSGGW